jgi:predicted TPR repeat methyltransferase
LNAAAPASPAWRVSRAYEQYKAGRLSDARAILDAVLRRQPDYADAHDLSGLIALAEGDAEAASAALARAADLDPRPERLNDLGAALCQAGRPDAAAEAFRRALTIDPAYARAWTNLAACLLDMDALPEAGAALDRAEALGANLSTQRNRAQWLKAMGRSKESVALLRPIVDSRPDDLDLRLDLALAEEASGDLQAAAVSLRILTTARPDWPRAWFMAGEIARAQDRPEEAKAAFRTALSLDPNDACGAGLALALLDPDEAPAQAPADFLRGLFDQYAVRFDQALVEKLGYQAPALLRALIDAHTTQEFTDVLDLGCGTGLSGEPLRPIARRLTGIDISAGMLARARDRKCYDALIEGDLTETLNAMQRETSDLAVAADVLVYLGDLAPLFAAVARALKPNGVFAFSVERLEDQGGDYRLTEGRRYAHAADYLQGLAAAQGFQTIAFETASTRRDRDKPVPGYLMLLRRP